MRRSALHWLRAPALHFLVLGGALFLLRSGLAGEPPAASTRRIELDATTVDELERDFRERTGRAPLAVERARLLDAVIEEEILYREALARGLLEGDGGVRTRLIQKMLFLDASKDLEDAPELLARAVELGLHRDDLVVRRILVQKMRLLGSVLEPDEAPTAEEIAAAYAARREHLRAPERRSLHHVFLSHDRRPERAHAEALALRRELSRERRAPETALALADPFPLGHRLARRSRRDLDRHFGPGFGEAVFGLEAGRWSDPIASAYGEHLVFVDAIEAGEVPPLEAVADRLRRELVEARRARKLDTLLGDLRNRYEVVLPGSPARSEETG